MRFVGIRIPVQLAKELRVRAAEQDLSLSELIRRSVARILEEDREQLRKLRRKHSISKLMAHTE